MQVAFYTLRSRIGVGSAEKRSGFAFGAGIFSLPFAFAERGNGFAIAGAFIFAFPFALGISRYRSAYLRDASRESRDETSASSSFYKILPESEYPPPLAFTQNSPNLAPASLRCDASRQMRLYLAVERAFAPSLAPGLANLAPASYPPRPQPPPFLNIPV